MSTTESELFPSALLWPGPAAVSAPQHRARGLTDGGGDADRGGFEVGVSEGGILRLKGDGVGQPEPGITIWDS